MSDPATRDRVPGSGIYRGTVRHRRLRPSGYAFEHGVYHVVLDLDELPTLDRRVRLFAHNRRGLTTFHDTDHLGLADRPVRDKLAEWVAAQGHELPDGPVLLWTNLRVLGYVFNPVSWFHCHDRDGVLRMVVAEVHNTFGDTYAYLLTDLEPVGGGSLRARTAKVFHVSPFMDVDGDYAFTVRPIDDRAFVHMDVLRGAAHDLADGDPDAWRLFEATLDERRRPFTTSELARALLRYPLVTLRTIVLIHLHAVRLWRRRGVRFFRRPQPPRNGLPGAGGQPAVRAAAHEPTLQDGASPRDDHDRAGAA